MEPSESDPAAKLLESLEWIDLGRYAVTGTYLRYDHRTRHALKEFRQKVVGAFAAHTRQPKNFLIWGAPGTGKSYLVQQVARAVGSEVEYVELNLAGVTSDAFRARLAGVATLPRPVLCLIDEVDAHPGESWPYEALLPSLEPATPRPYPTCFCLAGSQGSNLLAFKAGLGRRPKGTDLLSRIPRANEVSVDALEVGDRLLVAMSQLRLAATAEGREVREVEKLALYFLATNPEVASARQLRDLAAQSVERMPPGEDRFRYDHLFPAGDSEKKEFWRRAEPVRAALEGRFVTVDGQALDRRPEGAPRVLPSTPAVLDAPVRDSRWVAVLPFASFSPDPSDEYFADGITEELISAVSRLEGLSVISRTSVMTYKGRKATAGVIGRELGVGTLLEGSVRKSGTHVRVSAQLIEVRSDRPVWSETYDRDVSDLLQIQEEIAGRVAEGARGQMLRREVKAAAADPRSHADAHALYLKGRYFWNRATREWLEKAVVQFQRAVDLDPTYALGYAGLADAYLILGRRGDAPAGQVYPLAVANAQKALALDPRLAEPHAALGSIRQEYEWKWAEAEREFLRALELQPSASVAHAWYGLFLGHVGRFEDAVSEAGKAVELDPLAPKAHCWAAEEFVFARRFPEALEAAERALEIDPQYGTGEAEAGIALDAMGRHEEAIDRFERANRLFGAQAVVGRLGHAHAKAGHTEIARRLAAELAVAPKVGPSPNPALRPSPYNSLDVALVHLGLGDLEASLEWLTRARDQRIPEVVHFAHEPIYDAVRPEPAFQAIVRSIGL